MQRTITTVRALRLILPVLFVGFIVVITTFYSSRRSVEPSRDAPAVRPEREGEQARLISYEFEDTQTVGDRLISRIRAARTVGFESGWYTLDRAELVIFREAGGAYTLTAPSVEFNAETKEARAEGGVIVTSEDDLDLRTEKFVFDGRRLTNDVPVRFRMGRWSGTARGADLDIEKEILRLEEGVEASFGAEAGESVDLTARTAAFDRISGTVRFENDVRLVRAGDTYASSVMTAQTDQSQERIIGLEGEGNVEVEISPGSDLVVAEGDLGPGRKRVTAEQFLGRFDGDGRLAAIELFGGSGPVTLRTDVPVKRTMQAGSARINLSAEGAESAVLYGNVRLVEQGPTRRSVRAERLVVTFDQSSGEAVSAVFDGSVQYEDVRSSAVSERVFYDMRQDTVRLSSLPGKAPTIESGSQRISANEIVIEPEGRVLRANGRVITRMVNDGTTRTVSETALFPGEGSVFVNSDNLVVREGEGFAAFTGEVKAWQGSSTLFADELQIRSGGDAITARGNVRTILPNRETDGGEPIRSRSGRMEARRAARQIELIEEVRIESEGRSLSSDAALFVLTPDQKLDRVVATGGVVVRETATGRVGRGSKAVYELAEETILIEGRPAEMSESRGTIKGDQIVLDMKRNRVDVLRGDSPTEATYNAEPGDR